MPLFVLSNTGNHQEALNGASARLVQAQRYPSGRHVGSTGQLHVDFSQPPSASTDKSRFFRAVAVEAGNSIFFGGQQPPLNIVTTQVPDGWTDKEDLFWQAVTAMVLPAMVWLMCTLRAFQIQHLLMEAEMGAQQRMRSEFGAVAPAVEGETTCLVDTALPNHDEQLVLQRPSARIS